jgi:molybdenum cofactor cytidylyltransferase
MRDAIVAIVLGAGHGRRLGGPKALLSVREVRGGETIEAPLIEAQCRDRLEAESGRCLAVLRPDVAALVGGRVRAAGGEVVVSDAPESQGPAGSLAAAAAFLGEDALLAAIVTPVDVRVRPETLQQLLDACRGCTDSLSAVPRHAGRKGHPVIILPPVLARYREADPPPLRDVLRALGDRVAVVDVDDPFVLEDLNSPEQSELLARITGKPGPPSFMRH